MWRSFSGSRPQLVQNVKLRTSPHWCQDVAVGQHRGWLDLDGLTIRDVVNTLNQFDSRATHRSLRFPCSPMIKFSIWMLFYLVDISTSLTLHASLRLHCRGETEYLCLFWDMDTPVKKYLQNYTQNKCIYFESHSTDLFKFVTTNLFMKPVKDLFDEDITSLKSQQMVIANTGYWRGKISNLFKKIYMVHLC